MGLLALDWRADSKVRCARLTPSTRVRRKILLDHEDNPRPLTDPARQDH
jgi:hypothetical protein